MNFKAYVVIAASFFSVSIFAGAKESLNTIPFITYKTRVVYYSTSAFVPPSVIIPQATLNYLPSAFENAHNAESSNKSSTAVEQEATMSNIPIADLQKLIMQVRNGVCSSIGDSDVRVWVSIDASGKILGVGASTQSGLEVTFHCKGQ